MRRLLRKFVDIREGETLRAILMFGYIFLIIACLLIIKPVRNSLFLNKFEGAAKLPYAFILVAVFAVPVTSLYSRFTRQVRLNRLIVGSMLIIILSLLGFWLLLHHHYEPGWFIFVLYVWVAIFGVISTSQFWILANYVFNAREAKRLFSFIAAGGISGGIFGGYLTNYLAPLIGTANLIFVCIGFLTLCLVILQLVWNIRGEASQSGLAHQRTRVEEPFSTSNPLKLIAGSGHLQLLAMIVWVGVVVANLVDYQYNEVIYQNYRDPDEVTAFLGFWLSNLSVISLAIQLFLANRVFSRLGVGASLFFLPVGLLLGAAMILVYPTLWAAVIIKVTDGGFKQSINKSGIELLALPIPSAIKPQVKSFIDVFVDSFATGVSGFLLLIFTSALAFSVGQVSLIIIALTLAWLFMIVRVRNTYIQAFRMAIEKRSIDLDKLSINPEDASLRESVSAVFESNNERLILYVLDLLENAKNEQFIAHFKRLIQHPSPEIRSKILQLVSPATTADFSTEAQHLIEDDHQEVRIEAISYLFHRASPAHQISTFVQFLEHPNYLVRTAAMMCLARESARNSTLRNAFNLREMIENTLKTARELKYEGQKNFMKINIARSIGAADIAELYPYLHILINDSAEPVARAAVESAGKSHSREFIPVLIQLLKNRQLRKSARQSLVEYGEAVVEQLSAHLKDAYEDRQIRMGIARVLGVIGSQKSVDALIENLNQHNLLIRFQVLRALNRLRKNYPNLHMNEFSIENKILEESQSYMKTLGVLYAESSLNAHGSLGTTPDIDASRVKEARLLLIKALEEKLDSNLERIFRLLGLRYVPRDMLNAYHGVISDKQDLRANAVEFLDNVLASRLKKFIIPIVETNSLEALVEIGIQQFSVSVPDENRCLVELLEGPDDWLKTCALYLIAESKKASFLSSIAQLVNNRDPIVRETAQYALQRLEVTD